MQIAALEHGLIAGADKTPSIIAIEHRPGTGTPDQMALLLRDGNSTREVLEPFRPFLWSVSTDLLADSAIKAEWQELAGANPLKYLARFDSWKSLQAAAAHLKQKTRGTAERNKDPFFIINDPEQQHLLSTGKTLFKGMGFRELRRLQMDIETYCDPEYEFSNADREKDRIIAITLADSTGWVEVLSGKTLDEPGLIRRWVELIRERDPDVIEGHNLFNFDLPYLTARAKRYKIKVAIGRNGETIRTRPSRYVMADQVITYTRAEVSGRHVVDTYLLAQAYDISHRSLESLSLKDVARHFGVAAPDRTYIDGADIAATFDRDPDALMRYARDDILETRAISDILSPSYFTQAQILPFTYQNTTVRGSGSKIDSLMLRAYLAAGHSIPIPEDAQDFAGGYTDIFFTGIAKNVHHCDVRSLYPSLMLKDNIGPKSDELAVFISLLRHLRDFRVEAKSRMQQATSADEKVYLDALQTTFKILINSFYGYLGFSQGRFNDYAAASEIAEKGRKLLASMIDFLRGQGATPIEIDTDGIYFVPPEFKSPADRDAFRGRFAASLPAGIDVEFDGEYVSMLSYKMKNYALLDDAGEVTIKGAALKSRGLEPFQRDYIKQWLRFTLEDKPDAIAKLKSTFRNAIQQRTLPIQALAKSESLKESPVNYAAKIGDKARGRSAAYELAMKTGRSFQAGDQISYYVTGTKKSVAVHEAAKLVSEWKPEARDENVTYYVSKLEALIEKLDGIVQTSSTQEQELPFG